MYYLVHTSGWKVWKVKKVGFAVSFFNICLLFGPCHPTRAGLFGLLDEFGDPKDDKPPPEPVKKETKEERAAKRQGVRRASLTLA